MNVFLTGILPYFYIFNSIIINTSQGLRNSVVYFFDKKYGYICTGKGGRK